MLSVRCTRGIWLGTRSRNTHDRTDAPSEKYDYRLVRENYLPSSFGHGSVTDITSTTVHASVCDGHIRPLPTRCDCFDDR